jgi:hypothetical protein
MGLALVTRLHRGVQGFLFFPVIIIAILPLVSPMYGSGPVAGGKLLGIESVIGAFADLWKDLIIGGI